MRTYVSLANLWRVVGLEFLVNLDQRWPSFRFTRKFWEFYLSSIVRGKELQITLEVVKLESKSEKVDKSEKLK